MSVVILSGLVACSDSNPAAQPVAERTVCLEGAIGLSTRAVIGSGYEKDLPVGFVRQDESQSIAGRYGAWSVCKAVRQGGKGNRPIVFDESQWYPEDGRGIRLNGYYPAVDGVAVDTGTGKVVFTLDGTTDVMATGMLTATAYAPVRTCTFRHLLTQVRLVCYSDRAEEWGTIATIDAVDIHTRQELDCLAETPALADISSGDGIQDISVQDIQGLPVPGITAEEELPETQGYILLPVSPADGTAEHPLCFRITTTKDGRGNPVETVLNVSVSVEGGFRTGKSHVVTLFFTGNSRIQTASVSVEAWTDREQGDMPI